MLAKLLRYHYGKKSVQYVRNITDIDDKIIEAARETGEEIGVITEKYTRIYNEDMAALGVDAPDKQPRATEYIPQMLLMINRLLKSGHAYAAEGHVLFHVPAFDGYGQLSRRNRDDMIAGARVEVAPYKRDPADFILWKPSTPDQPGWDSPWGRGRPGWHLECSVMNEQLNGEHFDIHAGGEDLIFPHHENEIAQSVCSHGGKPYANVWVHNGHLMVEGKKMSKSLGNVLLVHDLIKKYPPEVLRYVLLSAHYRQPFDFTQDVVMQSKSTLDRYYRVLLETKDLEAIRLDPPPSFLAALDDDLNTPQAFAELALILKQYAQSRNDTERAQARGELLAAGQLIGLFNQDPVVWFQGGANDRRADIEVEIEKMREARRNKDYKTSDDIRDRLQGEYGVTVSVTATDIIWRKA